ncbi:CGNR zinc finger domain-containing protein [Micromonospora sp. WMMD1102]|uniref:CGNR zinc finger domain-containing protein n=1 Tax=Micromonospora sp. WMMD1102 TaxID=3016105 RepID=UPI002414E6F4|nr:CGNR zinc finger domain-containing protein [Micromonospora sp. WMMD1102]MDG4785113.1 CGNR zinc finger domain-containing protein [Micromonospora sp. WMMD1102]
MPLDVCQLPLVGGHPALDLVNTLERGAPPVDGYQPHDFLSDTSALLRWTTRVGLVSDAEADRVGRAWRDDPGAAHAGLTAVRNIREELHLVLLATIPDADGGAAGAQGGPGWGDPIAAGAALVGLQERWSGAAARATLVLDRGDPPEVRLAYGSVAAMLVADRIVESVLDVLLTTDLTRVRRCPLAEGGCGWLFLDQSRNGSRRWCRMADCGSTVKSRRLTERRRAARAGTR